jgi:hypothetical protein
LIGICVAVAMGLIFSQTLLPKGVQWYIQNPRYVLWMHGRYHYDRQIVYFGLNGDIWRDDVVYGKTFPELQTMFGQIHEICDFDSYSLAKVSPLTNSTCTFVKWADTDWFIEITNGRASSINLWKG